VQLKPEDQYMTYDEWILEYARAWRTKDDLAAAALFTENGIYRSSPTKEAHIGHAAIAAYWRRATATQEALDLRFGRPIAANRHVVVEWWATLRDPGWHPEAPTSEVTLPGCLVLRFADSDDRCQELREYYNPVFGETLSAPPGWGE
jgi:hypothetical protein